MGLRDPPDQPVPLDLPDRELAMAVARLDQPAQRDQWVRPVQRDQPAPRVPLESTPLSLAPPDPLDPLDPLGRPPRLPVLPDQLALPDQREPTARWRDQPDQPGQIPLSPGQLVQRGQLEPTQL
jgi:hypothetical protein